MRRLPPARPPSRRDAGGQRPTARPAAQPDLLWTKPICLPDQKCSGDKRRPRAIKSRRRRGAGAAQKSDAALAIATIYLIRDRRPGTRRCLVRFEETGLLGG